MTGWNTDIHKDHNTKETHMEPSNTILYHIIRKHIISYPLFAYADTGIYPYAASQYHARPKAKHGIAMLSVEKFPYPQKETSK